MAKPKSEAEFNEWTPPLYVVYCLVLPTARNGLTDTLLSRVGAAHSIEACRKLIADDKKAMGNTFGGLIAPSDISNRRYRTFYVGEWVPVTL